METKKKPHAVCIPCPFQSHIKATLQFAKLLHHKGFHITFVNTEFNHKRFLKSRGPTSLDGLPDFRFETIPDGLPPSDLNSTQDVPSLCDSIRKSFFLPFRDFMMSKFKASNIPPVTCIVSDGFMPFAVTVAEELDIPVVQLWTIAACGFLGIKQFPVLKEKGFTPVEDLSYYTESYMNTVIDWIPGMKDISLRDLPNNFQTTNPEDIIFNFFTESIETASRASAMIIHTYNALEIDVLNALSSIYSPIYTIGPFQLFLDQIQDPLMSSIGYNLWEEETECLQWLNSRETSSVVYVNFGSLTVMTEEQLLEFGWGLANSKYSFLWIIRPDLMMGSSAILPPEFFTETKERSIIASWCPQEEVLNHESVGGFLTHSGWGSTIESISAGVPMLCWPVCADQQTNCKFSCDKWGVGMEISNKAKRDEVEDLVIELMRGEKGKKMRSKAMEWKRMAEEAVSPNGSSLLNLNKLVKQMVGTTAF